MKVSLMFPSDFVKADDLEGKDVTKTVKAVTMDELTMARGKEENQPRDTVLGCGKEAGSQQDKRLDNRRHLRKRNRQLDWQENHNVPD